MCPFLDTADPRCGKHLTLSNIVSAFAHCADRYTECPAYRAMQRDLAGTRTQHGPRRRFLVAS